jgi:hypothetical protein
MPINPRSLDDPSPPRAYRVLHLSADGNVLMALPITAESDLEALTTAETLKRECAVELWDGLRFIEHFAHAPGASPVSCRRGAGLEGAAHAHALD